MLSSVDGKIDGAALRAVTKGGEYETTGATLNGDAWICGRTTMQQHFAEDGPFVPASNTPAGTGDARGASEARELLQAVLSEWIGFLFILTPKQFVIYADHDEYITFLAHRKGQLTAIIEALTAAKFRAVEYVRNFQR